MIFDVAIVGGGPVGIFSVFANGMQTLSSVIIEAAHELGGQCSIVYPEKNIYDIPGFYKITGRNLVDNLIEQIKQFNPAIELSSIVRSIVKQEKAFELSIESKNGNKKIYARTVLIALGAGIFKPIKPNLMNIEKFENKNIFYVLENIEKFKNHNEFCF